MNVVPNWAEIGASVNDDTDANDDAGSSGLDREVIF